jgi:hypothetical protein
MEPRNWTPVRIIAEAIYFGRRRISYLARNAGGLETVSAALEVRNCKICGPSG